VQQQTPEWFQARATRITASRFADVLAKRETKRYQGYVQEVAWGRLGIPDFKPEDLPWFSHGKEWEPEARRFYEWHTGREVQEAGLYIHPDLPFVACSPDGLSPDRGLEIKCRKSIGGHMETVRKKVDSIYIPQIQGGMWVCGFDKWDFVSFFKGRISGKETRLIHVHTVTRDDAYIERLRAACIRCDEDIDSLVRKLRKGNDDGVRAT
jgi:putative phage-type endonuclease